MNVNEIINNIVKIKETSARNSMGCLEDWYDFYYAMSKTFTKEQIENMSERECTLLYKLATNIQEALY